MKPETLNAVRKTLFAVLLLASLTATGLIPVGFRTGRWEMPLAVAVIAWATWWQVARRPLEPVLPQQPGWGSIEGTITGPAAATEIAKTLSTCVQGGNGEGTLVWWSHPDYRLVASAWDDQLLFHNEAGVTTTVTGELALQLCTLGLPRSVA